MRLNWNDRNTDRNNNANNDLYVAASVNLANLTYESEAIFVSALRGHINLDNPKPVVCIGTDRSTGDSYGPLLGTLLKSVEPEFPVYGTLDSPLHATNLAGAVKTYGWGSGDVLAVDACLGRPESVGSIKLITIPFSPGASVGKDLPSMGPPGILGTVNVGGFMDYMILQNTRLSRILSMVYVTARMILKAYGIEAKLDDARSTLGALAKNNFVDFSKRAVASSTEDVV